MKQNADPYSLLLFDVLGFLEQARHMILNGETDELTNNWHCYGLQQEWEDERDVLIKRLERLLPKENQSLMLVHHRGKRPIPVVPED